jgi:hypothetical protein
MKPKAASLPLSERLSPKTTSELYGLAAIGGLANATTTKANAGSARPKKARCMMNLLAAIFQAD